MKVVAIAAVTAGGKTTTVNELKRQLSNVQTLHFDDYVSLIFTIIKVCNTPLRRYKTAYRKISGWQS